MRSCNPEVGPPHFDVSSTSSIMNRCGGAPRSRFFADTARSTTSEDMCDRDNNNQEDADLADDDSEDFNELAAETSSLISCESSSFVCSEQNTITAVRVRPMLQSERKHGYRIIVDVRANNTGFVTRIVNPTSLPSPTRKRASASYTSNKSSLESTPATGLTAFPAQFTQEFWFDCTYWSFDRSAAQQVATQATIYDELGVVALQTLLQGHNCSVFAYGQQGAGKTYTMMGNSGERTLLAASARSNTSDVDGSNLLSTSERRGLIPRLCQGLFAEIDEGKRTGISSTVIMSYVEIYDERVYDLLSHATVKTSLKVREHPEDGAFVERAQRVRVTSSAQLMKMIEEGNRTHSVASCLPCRPHTVLTILLTQNAFLGSGDDAPRKSKLCLVDLAGSERVDHSETSGLRLREMASVNRSLATLADVVGALAKRKINRLSDQHQKTFVPYRNSVLTRLLKDCLGGRAKTIMIGAISPCCAHYEESISTLRIIERARSIYSTGRLQMDTGGDLTQRFLDEVNELTLDLCVADESSIPLVLPNGCCGTPECHNECPDCETCDLPFDDNNTPDQTPLEVEMRETTVDEAEITMCNEDNSAFQTKPESVAIKVHLLNLVAIRRRWQTLRQYRALEQWRKVVFSELTTVKATTENIRSDVEDSKGSAICAVPALVRKSGCPPLHTHTPTIEGHKMDRVQDVVADVVATDAICCSVVQKFLFPKSTEVLMKQSDTDAASLLEILASSSEFDRSEFRYTRCEDSTSSNEDGPLDDEENNANLDSAFDLRQEMEVESNDLLLSPELHDERSAYSTLTLCMDSIDMARRVLGPGVHNLRATKGTGVEYDLLRYLDKKLIAMTQNFGDLLANLQWTPSRSTCEALEALISEFCLQIVARLCDQLPSASSACIAGRLQLEAQLERFENCLKQQLLPEIARSITGEEGNENYIISLFSVVTELLVMTERITLVWTLAGHQKRGRLLQAQALEATTTKERKMAAKIAILEESNVELSAKYDVLLATNAGLDGSMEVKRKANPTLTHGIKLGAKSAIEMTLENQLTELKRISLEQNVELENIRADLSEARSKAESDAALLLSRTSELEHQLSSALEKACRAESEIVLQAATLESQAMLLKKAQTQRESAEMRVENISTNCAILVDKINIQTRQITGLENRILKDKQHSIEMDSSLAVAMQDRDELVLLLSQTEEALASALNREKGLQSQLLGPISRESEDMNRVRGELHEATLELASLREELAELLDHSTLQSTTIEALKLEVDDAVQRTRDIESERDDLMLQYQKEKCLLEQKEQECLVLSHQFTASLSKLERQQEIEREGCMTIHEALQRQTCSFQKVQARQHSIKMDYCSTIRDLKRQLEALVAANTHEAETRRVTAKLHVQEFETQTKLSILNLEVLVYNLTNKLHECKQDLKSTIQNWIRAEMQCGVQRVCIQRLTSNLLEATESCKMQLCDTESSSLRKGIAQDSVSIPSESELLVNDHLSSLDAWFDDVISGNQEIPSLVNTAPDLAPIRAQNEDSTASSSLLKTLTDLSALTNELLVVCESASDSETHFNNSLAEKSDQQAQIPVGTTNEKRKVKQKEKPSNEVIQLRKIVVKLKEALDAKDDMLLFLDGKVRRLELCE